MTIVIKTSGLDRDLDLEFGTRSVLVGRIGTGKTNSLSTIEIGTSGKSTIRGGKPGEICRYTRGGRFAASVSIDGAKCNINISTPDQRKIDYLDGYDVRTLDLDLDGSPESRAKLLASLVRPVAAHTAPWLVEQLIMSDIVESADTYDVERLGLFTFLANLVTRQKNEISDAEATLDKAVKASQGTQQIAAKAPIAVAGSVAELQTRRAELAAKRATIEASIRNIRRIESALERANENVKKAAARTASARHTFAGFGELALEELKKKSKASIDEFAKAKLHIDAIERERKAAIAVNETAVKSLGSVLSNIKSIGDLCLSLAQTKVKIACDKCGEDVPDVMKKAIQKLKLQAKALAEEQKPLELAVMECQTAVGAFDSDLAKIQKQFRDKESECTKATRAITDFGNDLFAATRELEAAISSERTANEQLATAEKPGNAKELTDTTNIITPEISSLDDAILAVANAEAAERAAAAIREEVPKAESRVAGEKAKLVEIIKIRNTVVAAALDQLRGPLDAASAAFGGKAILDMGDPAVRGSQFIGIEKDGARRDVKLLSSGEGVCFLAGIAAAALELGQKPVQRRLLLIDAKGIDDESLEILLANIQSYKVGHIVVAHTRDDRTPFNVPAPWQTLWLKANNAKNHAA